MEQGAGRGINPTDGLRRPTDGEGEGKASGPSVLLSLVWKRGVIMFLSDAY